MTGPAQATGLELPDAERIAAQLEVYNSDAPGSIFALQPYRNDMSLTGADGLEVTLTSMNPGVNAWFILRVAGGDHGRARFYHLENADPAAWQVSLDHRGRRAGDPARKCGTTLSIAHRGRGAIRNWRPPVPNRCPMPRSVTGPCTFATGSRATAPRARPSRNSCART